MSETSQNRQMAINLIAAIISFAVNAGINFFLTPYLVKELGTDTYGFIGLANSFVQYATMISSALNAMSGRFISIAYHQGNREKASRLFSSVLVADLFLAAVMLIATSVLTLYLDVFLVIPAHLVNSVKLTFAITFLTFVISIVTAIFTTATFVKNRIDINSIRDIISNLIKIALVVGLFTFLPAQLYYIALATLASGVFLMLANITVKKKILPDIEISFKKFKFKYVITIVAAGIWMSLAQLSNAIISSIDLLICNIALGATLMGVLSIAKTIPHCIGSLISTLAGIFNPHYTILYAKNDIKGLVNEVNFTSRIVSFILTVPIAGFIAFSYEFYTLWQPTKTPDEIYMIQVLSLLTCLMYLFNTHTQCMSMLNSVCNKLKIPVLITLGTGILSILIVVAALAFGNLGEYGIYVIAGTSSLLMSLRSLIFIPLYSAHMLKQKWWTFYPSIIRGWIAFFVLIIFFTVVNTLISIHGWFVLICVLLCAGVFGYLLTLPVMFNMRELNLIKQKIIKKLKKQRTA